MRKKKKRYKHPVITVIKLDPEQALLVVCKSGGAYFGTIAISHCTNLGTRTVCPRAVKGVRQAGRAGWTTSTAPS